MQVEKYQSLYENTKALRTYQSFIRTYFHFPWICVHEMYHYKLSSRLLERTRTYSVYPRTYFDFPWTCVTRNPLLTRPSLTRTLTYSNPHLLEPSLTRTTFSFPWAINLLRYSKLHKEQSREYILSIGKTFPAYNYS